MSEFVMLIGPSGCGKSYHAEAYSVLGYDVVASDEIRTELYGDETIQKDPAKIFKIARQRVQESLDEGRSVVLDATNLKASNRVSFLEGLRGDFDKVAHIIVAPFAMCFQNQQTRKRQVPANVIRKQFGQFEMPQNWEGWTEIKYTLQNLLTVDETVGFLNDLTHDNSHHEYGVGEHCFRVKNYVMERTGNRAVIDAAYWHDLGKLYTKSFYDAKGNLTKTAHYYNHHNWGSYYSLMLADNFLDTPMAIYRAQLIQLHMEPFFKKNLAWKKFCKKYPKDMIEAIKLIHAADIEEA